MKSLPKSLLESLLQSLPEGVLVVARQGDAWQAAFHNPAFVELSRLDSGDVAGQSLQAILEKIGARDEWARIRRFVANGESLRLTVYPGTPDRPGAPLALAVNPLDGGSEGEYAACYLTLRRGEAEAADGPPSASESLPSERRDPATGLASRNFFDGVLVHDWAVAQREAYRLSLLVYRIDAFGAYLDTFGRHAAESMVRRVARCITRRLRRASDIAARLEEDCIVALVHGSDETGVLAFAESIATEVGDLRIHHPRSPVDRFVTVQCSVHAALPEPESDPEGFVMEALAAEFEE
ncbi:MAG: diguanylate cyclase [Gammaproteobacteria bacterium]|jgi:diguanylate cyclase (GGDEF)-like protein